MDILNQLTETSLSGINISLVIVLVGVGAVLKHAIKNLDNNYIPVILITLGAILVVCTNIPFNAQTELLSLLVSGMASGFCATMVHSKGRDIFGGMLGTKNEEEKNETDDIEEL